MDEAVVVVASDFEELFGLGGFFVEGLAVCVGDDVVVAAVDDEEGAFDIGNFVLGGEVVADDPADGQEGDDLFAHGPCGAEGAFENRCGGVDFCGELCGDGAAE